MFSKISFAEFFFSFFLLLLLLLADWLKMGLKPESITLLFLSILLSRKMESMANIYENAHTLFRQWNHDVHMIHIQRKAKCNFFFMKTLLIKLWTMFLFISINLQSNVHPCICLLCAFRIELAFQVGTKQMLRNPFLFGFDSVWTLKVELCFAAKFSKRWG